MIRAASLSLLIIAAVSAGPAFAQDGAAVYARACVSCHEQGAVARAPSREVISALSVDRIVNALETGTMRTQGEGLTPAERRAVATFLSTDRGSASASTRACASPGAALRPGPTDWQAWGVTQANERYQRQSGITAAQVPNLKLRWAFGFDGENAAAANPTIVGDRIFVGSGSGRVFALGLADGCQHWMFKADTGVRAAITIGIDSNGRPTAYFGDLRATLYAVDATTGELRWKQRLDEHRAARITGSAVVHDGRVFVGVASAEEATGAPANYSCCTFRGHVVALNAATGDRVWDTYMIPETPSPQGKNRAGTVLMGPAGAGVWSAPTIDLATNSLYVTTGDGYTTPAAPLTDAVVALDIATGAVKWAKQVTAGDAYTMACTSADTTNCPQNAGPDHDFGQSAILLSLATGKRVLVAGQKSGIVHAFDPDDKGAKLWTTEIGKGGMLGGIEWGSSSDGTNMYVPVSDITFKDPIALGRGGLKSDVGGGLFAIRLTNGSQAWVARVSACADKPSCSPALSAPSAAIPGAVFSGSLDGHFRAYSTTDGRVLWDFDSAKDYTTANGVRASGGSIDVGGPAIANGVVATTSGYGQWGGMRGNVLLVFSVDGR
jgi:polyvinyl alcohol dehydrogenase (cytochrome)